MTPRQLRLTALTFALSMLAGYLFAGSTEALPTLAPRRGGAAVSTSFAPATAPLPLDSLPAGRHVVSSYNNDRSIEVTVENRRIQQLTVDGKVIPAEEFPDYEDRVAQLFTNGPRHKNGDAWYFSTSVDWTDDRDVEAFEKRMEEFGEHMERFGEELGERVEKMFEWDEDGNGFTFEFDGSDFDMDTIIRLEFPDVQWDDNTDPDVRVYDLEELIEERQRALEQREEMLEDNQRELEEMETMIERLEARRAGRTPTQLDEIVRLLRAESLIPDAPVRKIEFSYKEGKINGKKLSDEAHARLLDLYFADGQRNFSTKFEVKQSGVEW